MNATIAYIELFLHLQGQPLSGELAYILTTFAAACEWLTKGAPGVEIEEDEGEDPPPQPSTFGEPTEFDINALTLIVPGGSPPTQSLPIWRNSWDIFGELHKAGGRVK